MRLNALSLVGVAVVSALLATLLSAGKFHAYDADFAHHYALIRTLMDFWGVPSDAPNLLEMRVYPRFSHWIAALVGHVTGSGLSAMSHVSVASTALIYVGLFALVLRSGIGPIVVCVALLVGLVCVRLSGRALFGNEVVGGFFFAQVVGSALFVWALWGAASADGKASPWVLDLLALFAIVVIAFAHLLPALQFAGTYGLVLCYGAAIRPGRSTFARIGIYCALAASILALHPTVPVMMRIANHEGGVFFDFTMIAALRVAIPLCAAAIAAVLLIHEHRSGRTQTIWLSAAGFACSTLALSQFAILHITGRSSPYAVDKHMYAVVSFGVVNAAVLVGLALSKRQAPATPTAIFSVGLAAVAVSHLVLSRLTYRASPILQYQEVVRSAVPQLLPKNIRAIVLNASFPPALNYLITIGDLRTRRGKISYDVLYGRAPSKSVGLVFVAASDPAVSGPCAVQPFPLVDYHCLARLPSAADGNAELQ